MSSNLMPFIIIFAVIGIVVWFAIRGNKAKKCSVCGLPAKDSYRDSNDKNIVLCRSHLAIRWRGDFLASPQEMAVVEPDFDRFPDAYLYGTIEDLKDWNYPKECLDNISGIINGVAGKKCQNCKSPATVAYFKKEDYEPPFLEKINAIPVYLCKQCIVEKIEFAILNAKKKLVEGVSAPKKDAGIYHVQIY